MGILKCFGGNSSIIRELIYEEDIMRLTVILLNGKECPYGLVPKAVFEAFCNSPSKGAFYNTHIKGIYS